MPRMSATIVAIAAALLIVLMLAYSIVMNRRARENWVSTEGVIVESRVDARNEPGADRPNIRYGARVTYQYDVGGTAYRGNRLSFVSPVWRADRHSAEADAARYPQGARVTVHYDPANPQNAVLEIRSE